MVDSSLSSLSHDLFFNDDDDDGGHNNGGTNDFDLPQLSVSSTLDDDAVRLEKRKYDPPKALKARKKKKKTKSVPSYMRRNIRHLLTSDKLQGDTLSALRAEQERLKRLQETNGSFAPFQTIYTHVPNRPQPLPTLEKLPEDECIVLDDEEDDDDDDEDDDDDDDDDSDEENGNTTAKAAFESGSSCSAHSNVVNDPVNLGGAKEPNGTLDDNADSNDSDVQCVDSDTEIVNDKITKKMQRLHVDDRVNVPDENGE